MYNRATDLDAEKRQLVTVTSQWKSTIYIESLGCCVHVYSSDFHTFGVWCMTRSAELRKAVNHSVVGHMAHFDMVGPGSEPSLTYLVDEITGIGEWRVFPSELKIPRLEKEYIGPTTENDTELLRVSEVVRVRSRGLEKEFSYYYRVMVAWNTSDAYLKYVTTNGLGHAEGFHRHQDDLLVIYK